MKVYAILFLNKNINPPVIVSSGYYLNDLMFWERPTAKDVIQLICRSLVSKTDAHHRLVHQGYMCHSIIFQNGLSCCGVTDEEYPFRVIDDILYQSVTKFNEQNFPWNEAQIEKTFYNDYLNAYLEKIQNPVEFDKLIKINKDIEATRDVVISNIDLLMSRGEKLNDLEDRTNTLVKEAKKFQGEADRLNSCCVIL